jgi:hypothetical protein
MSNPNPPNAFEKGNTLARAVQEDEIELMQQAYESYCEHIANGNPIASWWWKNPRDPKKGMVAKTLEKYIDKYGDSVFPLEQKEMALARSLGHWFGVTAESAKGINTKANTASLQMIMRNVHKWDKATSKTETTNGATTVTVTKYADTDD